jgi:hypothetical protein
MSEPATLNGLKDQADGLRELFGKSPPPVHVVCCPSRPALALSLVSELTQGLIDLERTIMWADEIDFAHREQVPLPCKVRFDLSKTLQGFVDLEQSVSPLQPGLWYGLSLHTARIKESVQTLSDRLMRSGVEFDSVIVSTAALKAQSFKHYGARIHCTAITGCELQELNQTFEWLAHTQEQTPVASWSLVLAGQAGSSENSVGWAEEKVKLSLGPEVKVLGHLETPASQLPLKGTWSQRPELTSKLTNHLLMH